MEINRFNAGVGLEPNTYQIPGDSVYAGHHDNVTEALQTTLPTIKREVCDNTSVQRIPEVASRVLDQTPTPVEASWALVEPVQAVPDLLVPALLNTDGEQMVDSTVDAIRAGTYLSEEEVLDKVTEYVSALRANVENLQISPTSILDDILRLVTGEIVPEWQRENVSQDILSSIKEMDESIRTNSREVRTVNRQIEETTYGTLEQLAESCRTREEKFNALLAPLKQLWQNVEAKVQELRSDMETRGIQPIPELVQEDFSRLGYDVDELEERVKRRMACHAERLALLSHCLAAWSSIRKAYDNLRHQLNWCVYRHEEYIKKNLPLPWGIWQSRFPSRYTGDDYYLKDVR